MVADGAAKGMLANILFVAGCVAIILSILWLLVMYYERILRWCLDNRWKFMLIPELPSYSVSGYGEASDRSLCLA